MARLKRANITKLPHRVKHKSGLRPLLLLLLFQQFNDPAQFPAGRAGMIPDHRQRQGDPYTQNKTAYPHKEHERSQSFHIILPLNSLMIAPF